VSFVGVHVRKQKKRTVDAPSCRLDVLVASLL
jgi:hypothetical protein